MSLVSLDGTGWWSPLMLQGLSNSGVIGSSDGAVVDLADEEVQLIGQLRLDGGGAKTFGGGSSAVGWLVGASITFASGATLRVGVKPSTAIVVSAGPVGRATLGAAAFAVYDDLVGGTDTITATTWREDVMSAGTPFSVAQGDNLAICFHLAVSSGSPNVKVRAASLAAPVLLPVTDLATNGPTYTAVTALPNVMLTMSDGTRGWLDPSFIFSAIDTSAGNIGVANIYGNILQFPFGVSIYALAASVNPVNNTADFALDLYSTPLGTPTLLASVAVDANVTNTVGAPRLAPVVFPTPVMLNANTPYAIGIRQTTANNVQAYQRDVAHVDHWKVHGLGATCYGAISTAGGTFVQQLSGRRRYNVYARVSGIEMPASTGGGGLHLVGAGGLAG